MAESPPDAAAGADPSLSVRAMVAADVPIVGALTARAFEMDLDAIEVRRPGSRARWFERIAYPLHSDPDGAFVAVRDGAVVGVAEAIVRESLWVLSLLAIDPERQSGGVGRELMAAAMGYAAVGGSEASGAGSGAEGLGGGARAGGPPAGAPGLIVASNDARALRLYGRAEFDLRPTFSAEGELKTQLLEAPSREIREVDAGGLEALDAVTREVRGAPYTTELEWLIAQGGSVHVLPDRGFVAVGAEGSSIWALVAADDLSARKLLVAGLWRCADLASSGEPAKVELRWLTAEQRWASSLALDLGLSVSAYGAICVRGEPGRLTPFLPSGPFA